METIKARLVGKRPLLMHSSALVDPLNPAVKALNQAVDEHKRSKTEDAALNVAYREFVAGMYYDPDLGPYIPAENIHATLIDAAKTIRKGETVKRGVVVECEGEGFPLTYDGPRDVDSLWEQEFWDRRVTRVQRNSVMRTRPKFPDWSIEDVVLSYDPQIIDDDDMSLILGMAGNVGLGDYRERFGKFDIETY